MASKDQTITAIIYDRRGRVLSVGKNSYTRTHPHQALHARRVGQPDKIYLHAEIAAIIKCRDLSKAHRIVVSRVTPGGAIALAKPCVVCQSAITAAGISIIEHT